MTRYDTSDPMSAKSTYIMTMCLETADALGDGRAKLVLRNVLSIAFNERPCGAAGHVLHINDMRDESTQVTCLRTFSKAGASSAPLICRIRHLLSIVRAKGAQVAVLFTPLVASCARVALRHALHVVRAKNAHASCSDTP